MKAAGIPLRISNDRVVLYGTMLALIASAPFIIFPTWFHDVAYRGDFANFWSAGSNVGTTRLLDAAALAVWQTAHGITAQVFVYPPGVAWLYAPLAWLPPIPAMILGDAAMVAVLVAAGIVMAKIYGFPRWFALAGVFAWGPAVNAIELGQNTPLALLAICVAVWSLVNRREALLGLAVGLLLYKPSVALPFVLLLLVRSQWRALAVVAAAGAGWYLLSLFASHGNTAWPAQWIHLVQISSVGEFGGNSHKTFTVPTLLLSAGVPPMFAIGAGIGVLLAALPLLARRPAIEAGSMTAAIGLATSIHAWPYEATLLLPAVFFIMIRLAEPARTPIIAATYVVAALALVLPYAGHGLALLSLGIAAWWLSSGYRAVGARDKIADVPVGQSL
ncbi:MAG: glycosyltransferase family 87 protein [Candidatus Cybelea sp.]